MMGNFFNRMYNGKSNQGDFTPDHLPANRFALFFDMLKIRLFKLVQLNLLFLLFTLPMLFFWGAFFIFTVQNVESAEAVQGMFGQTLLFNIPSMAIAGIGIAGMTYVARNWARDQHAWVWSDFIDAIKTNWKQSALLGLFDGAALFLIVQAAWFYYLNSADGNVLFYFLSWVMIIFLLVLALINLYIWPMLISYELKLIQLIRNSLVLALGRLPFSLLFLIVTLIPIVIALFYPTPVMIYYGLIGLAMTCFINVSYTNAVFDRFINVKIADAPVNMGLRVEEEDEDGDSE